MMSDSRTVLRVVVFRPLIRDWVEPYSAREMSLIKRLYLPRHLSRDIEPKSEVPSAPLQGTCGFR